MKTVSRRLVTTSIICMLVLTLAGWITTSQSGLRWLVDISRPYLPAELKLGKIQGTLSDIIIVSDFAWHSDTIEIVLTDIQLDCDWLEFLVENYQCDAVFSNNVTIINKPSATLPANTPVSHIERLQPIKLKFRAAIGELKIGQLLWQEKQTSVVEQKAALEELNIAQLAWTKNKLKWIEARAKSGPYSTVIKGSITALADWPLKLQASLALPNNTIQLSAVGDIFGDSDWAIKSTGQINSDSNAQVKFRDGNPLMTAIFNAPSQDLSWLYPSLSVEYARVPINIDWLKAELEVNSKLMIDGNHLDFVNKVVIDNILNWQSNLKGEATIRSQLTPQDIHKYLSPYIGQSAQNVLFDSRDKKELISPIINASYEFNNGHLQADSDLEISNILRTNAKFELDIIDNRYENLAVTGKITIPKTPDNFALTIQRLFSEFTIQQAFPDSTINYSISGSVDKIEHQFGLINELSWQVAYTDKVKASVIVNDATAHINSYDIPIGQTNITIDGKPTEHLLSINSTINNVNSSLSLIGAISIIENEIWNARNLKLLFDRGQRQLNLSMTDARITGNGLQINNLCLKDAGSVCGSVIQTKDELQLNALISNFSTTALMQWSHELGLELPLDVDGLVSGDVKLKHSANQIQTFDVSLTSPKLAVSIEDASLWLEDLQLKSNKAVDDIGLDVNWSQLHGNYILEGKQISLDTPKGIIRADLNKTEDIKVSLLIQENVVTLDNVTTLEDILTQNQPSEESISVNIPEVNLTARYSDQAVKLTSKVELVGNDHINLDLQSTWPLNLQSQLVGDIEISLTQFNWLKRWQSRIDVIDLFWQQKNHISGSIDKLSITGDGNVRINSFVMQELGLEITDSFLKINSQNNELLLEGLLKNKQGEVNFNGNMTLWPNIEMTAELVGQDMTVVDTADQKLVLSPKFSAHYREQHLTLIGDVVFNQANIRLNKLPVPKVDISDDETFLGQQQDKDKSFSYDISLNLNTGDDVAFQGFGLSSNLTGRLKLLAQKGKTINIEGELQLLNGQFEAYKQSLTIEQGQLIFLGAANNPGIQFRATRIIDEIKVGVIADGTLLQPRLTLYSAPAMAEENILALLLTGRSIESLTISEGNALANAALSIGVNGANRIAQKIADSLGLKNIQITAENTATSTSVNIETQINQRLTAGYGTTIDSQNETQSGWILEYRLTPKLSIEAISGKEVSTSITYKNQFDSDEPEKNQ